MIERRTLTVPNSGEVSVLLEHPDESRGLTLVLSHGAGAGMEHAFMGALSRRLVERGVAVYRFQFPYMEAGHRRTDRPDVATTAVRAAVADARERMPGTAVFAGGKSFGGRMTTTAAARGMLGDGRERGAPHASVSGIVLFGFPLHPAGKPGTSRAEHLADVPHPQLYLQGTRDRLADLELLRPVLEGLGERAELHVVEGADHGFHVLVRSGRTDDEVLDELAHTAADWMDRLASDRRGR